MASSSYMELLRDTYDAYFYEFALDEERVQPTSASCCAELLHSSFYEQRGKALLWKQPGALDQYEVRVRPTPATLCAELLHKTSKR